MAAASFGFILGLYAGTQLRERYDFPTTEKLLEASRIFEKNSLEESIQTSPTPHIVLADALMRAIHDLESLRNQFDILFIYLPRSWSSCFSGGDKEDFDLHDYLKASTAQRRLLSETSQSARPWATTR